jgi:hypothetical protein
MSENSESAEGGTGDAANSDAADLGSSAWLWAADADTVEVAVDPTVAGALGHCLITLVDRTPPPSRDDWFTSRVAIPLTRKKATAVLERATALVCQVLGRNGSGESVRLDSDAFEAFAESLQLVFFHLTRHEDRLREAPDFSLHDQQMLEALERLFEETVVMCSPFRPCRAGDFLLLWTTDDRRLVADLIEELRTIVAGSDDPALSRLFPDGYTDDDDANVAWQLLARHDLAARRLAAMEVVAGLQTRTRCEADELGALTRTLNDIRLVLAERMDLTEESVQPRRGSSEEQLWAVYEHLGARVHQLIAALRTTL